MQQHCAKEFFTTQQCRFCLEDLDATTLTFTERLLISKKRHKKVDVIYMDFEKLLTLFIKLKSFGIVGKLWLWLTCYLKNHHQRACVDNS